MKHIRFVNQAIDLAHKSNLKSYHHGCIIVKGGHKLSSGYNTRRTRFNKSNVTSIHAECCALLSRKSKKRILWGYNLCY